MTSRPMARRHFDSYIAYVLHRHGIDHARVIGMTPGAPPTELGVMASSAVDESGYACRAQQGSANSAGGPGGPPAPLLPLCCPLSLRGDFYPYSIAFACDFLKAP